LAQNSDMASMTCVNVTDSEYAMDKFRRVAVDFYEASFCDAWTNRDMISK